MRTSRTFASIAAVAALTLSVVPVAGAAPLQPVPGERTGADEVPAELVTPADPDAVAEAAAATAQALGVDGDVRSLVDALRADLGSTLEEFLAQAENGAELGALQSDFASQFTEVFGGAWLDDDGAGRVGIAPGDQSDDLRAAVEQAGFTPTEVDHSLRDLTEREDEAWETIGGLPEEQAELVTDVRVDTIANDVVVTTNGGTQAMLGLLIESLSGLASLDAQNAPDPADDTAPVDVGSSALGTGQADEDGIQGAGDGAPAGAADDGSGSALTSSLEVLSDFGLLEGTGLESLLALAGGAGDATGSVIEGMGEPDANSQRESPADGDRQFIPVPEGDITGGTAYDVQADNGVLECSTGFNGTLDGQPVVITAAHCAGEEGSRAAFPGDEAGFGEFVNVRYDGVDSAIILVDEEHGERFENNLVGAGGGNGTQEITGSTPPVVGMDVCKTGARTGFSCGTVTDVGVNVDVAGDRQLDSGFIVDVCALPGDSGGVVFAGDNAVGISSASNVAGSADCDSAGRDAGMAGGVPKLSAVPIDTILAAHGGLELRTS